MATQHDGSRNPERSMELLWGSRERPTRGPKPRLSVERIVRAGIEIADADGLAALSMRRVAEKLDVGVMSLYRYVPGKDELVDVMFDTVIADAPGLDGVTGGWRAKLEALTRGDWELYQRHPWVLQIAATHTPLGPNTIASFEAMLRTVSETGLPGSQVVAVTELLDNYARGAAGSALELARGARRSEGTDEEWWMAQAPLWEKYVESARYPTISRLFEEGAFDQFQGGVVPTTELFEFGLQRILDGVELLVGRHPQPDQR